MKGTNRVFRLGTPSASGRDAAVSKALGGVFASQKLQRTKTARMPFLFALALAFMVLAAGITACSKDDPEALAKRFYELDMKRDDGSATAQELEKWGEIRRKRQRWAEESLAKMNSEKGVDMANDPSVIFEDTLEKLQSGELTLDSPAKAAMTEPQKAAAQAQKEIEKVSKSGKITGANFGGYPADYPIANLSNFTIRDLYGPDTRFNMLWSQRPCRIVIASSSGNADEFTATLILKVRNSQDKEVDAFRLEMRFHADNVAELSRARYVKLDNLGQGNTAEYEYYPGGDLYQQGEFIGAFLGAVETFWNKDWDPKNAALPEELWGTWFREGAASGLPFDSTWIITARQTQVKFSDGISRIDLINKVDAWTNNPNDSNNKAANKAAEYPAGWRFDYTILEHEDSAEVGKNRWNVLILNASKNAFTQLNDDLKDIWVKR